MVEYYLNLCLPLSQVTLTHTINQPNVKFDLLLKNTTFKYYCYFCIQEMLHLSLRKMDTSSSAFRAKTFRGVTGIIYLNTYVY